MGLISQYPEPLIVRPLSQSHRQTFIILHGRGSSAEKFGTELLQTLFKFPSIMTDSAGDEQRREAIDQAEEDLDRVETVGKDQEDLQACFPHAKFVFPTASTRRAKIFKRSPIHQWFDYWKLPSGPSDSTAICEKEDLQVEGLRESSQFIHDLIERESKELGGDTERIILGGLSQGCAAGLISLLLWRGSRLGSFFGMCGWLPFCRLLQDAMSSTGEEQEPSRSDEDDPFDRGPEEGFFEDEAAFEEMEGSERSYRQLQEMLEMGTEFPNLSNQAGESRNDVHKQTPVFLGHGMCDEKVDQRMSGAAGECLSGLGIHVTRRVYADLGHWYNADMLAETASFVRNQIEPSA